MKNQKSTKNKEELIMIDPVYKKHNRLMRKQLHKKNIQADVMVYSGAKNLIHAYFECLCLQQKNIDNYLLFNAFQDLIRQMLDVLLECKENTDCFEIIKVLLNSLSRMEKEYRSKKMVDLQDEMFEDYLKSLANDDNFVIPPEDIDREADKYRAEPKYTGQEPVKRKWWQWLCRIKK